jgi:hypothetical protein
MPHLITVPPNLILEETIRFANSFEAFPDTDQYIFDFRYVRRIEPFDMLFLSSELKRYRATKPDCRFTAQNYDQNSYAAHMGFYKAFGLDYGKAPGEALGSGTYIPITFYSTDEIRQKAREKGVAPAKLLEEECSRMSSILTRADKGELFDVMVYSLREILRNIVEHSRAENFSLCAQYWPSLRKVALAIKDDGRGIRESLSENPHLRIESDEDALNLALQPGVSGTAFAGAYIDPDDAWANSGYGLYMTSNICREGGSFFITSGSKGIYFSENKHRILETPVSGTALNLALNIDRVQSLQSMLESYRSKASDKGAQSPSKSSKGLSYYNSPF